MLAERQRLDTEIQSISLQLKQLPSGRLICSRNGNRYKWYHTDGETQTYIPKKDRAYAEQLATRKYLTLLMEEYIQEKRSIDFYLKHHHSDFHHAEQLLTKHPGYQELLTPYFKPQSEEIAEWVEEPYEQNPTFPDQAKHKTLSGKLVRSKSEALIAMTLDLHHIPYRYECALQLGEVKLYPDFTILHPRSRQIYYWEHFGMADNPLYCGKAFEKQRLYANHGIIPSMRLITTYETNEAPLNMELVENLVKFYFE